MRFTASVAFQDARSVSSQPRMSAVPALATSTSMSPSSLAARGDQVRGRLRIGHVGGHGDGPPTESARVLGHLLRVVAVAAVGQAHVDALIGQASADGLPDASRRAGEQRDAAREIRHGRTRIRIGSPSAVSSFWMPMATSSSDTTSLMDRDRSRRPRETRPTSVPMSAFW